MGSYYTLLTAIGQAKLANAVALGDEITITHLAVGDANGVTPTPDSDRAALVNERRRAPINRLEVADDNPNWIVVEQVLPPDVGGWEIREIGVFDHDGDLIAYGNYPTTYKPTLDEGSGRTQTVRMVLQVSDTAAVTLRVDPSVVLATRKYVDDGDQNVTQAAAQALQQHVEAETAHNAKQVSVAEILQAPSAETVQQALAGLGVFAADGFQNIAVFDTAGVTDWDVPEVLHKGLRKAEVTVTGGGGAGSYQNLDGRGGGGGGGGGGETRIGMCDLSGILSVKITIGAGGVGSKSDSEHANGGKVSSFGPCISSVGGNGATQAGQGGTGGGAGTGRGAGGDLALPGSGGGARDASGGVSGQGGSSFWGGGGRASFQMVAEIISGYCGGGGAGGRGDLPAGSGGDGIVVVRW